MNHSSLLVLCFVVIVNLSLTAGVITIQGNSYYPYEEVVTNIANGSHKSNVFNIANNPDNTQGNQPPGMQNRFGDTPYTAPPRRVNNYGVGNYNQHTFNIVGPRPTQGSTSSGSSSSEYNGSAQSGTNAGAQRSSGYNGSAQSGTNAGSGYKGGTSFVAGTSTFHVGYGTNNHNFINGRPVPAAPAPAVNNGVPNFASRSGTINNLGFGKNNRNTVNFGSDASRPVSGNNGGRNPQPQVNIDHATVNGVPIQPDYISPTGFRTYNLPGQTVSVLDNSGGNLSPANIDKIRALSSQLQHISRKIQEAAKIQ